VTRGLAPTTASAACQPAGRLGFGFGRRFFLVALLGVLWAVPAFWNQRFLLLMLAWNLFALLAWGLDLWRLPRPGALWLERTWSGPVSLNNESAVMVRLHNPSPGALDCSLMDDVPAALRDRPPELRIVAAARSSSSQPYSIRPVQRGDVALGGMYFRYRSAAGFAERWAKADLGQSIRIFPDLEEARRQNIYLARARQIELEKRLARQRGMGREFERLREYQEGDEFRNICWTATARRGKYVTRLFQVERSQAVWLVIDAGRLQRAKVGALSKLDLAVNAALALAQMALYSGDRVGLLVYGRTVQKRVGAGRGLPHLRILMESLALAREEAAEADHLLAASALLQLQKQRSLVLWITDLADTSMTPEVIESASRVLAKHLLLFTVIAQADLLALAAKYPENGGQLFEIMAALELVQRREALLTRVRDKGALALEVMPGLLTTTLVNQYLQIKERGLL